MSTPKNIHPEDLPLYAMQLLSPEENAAIEALLRHDPTTRQEVAEIQGVLAAVAFAAEAEAPPAAARARFLKAVAQEKRSASAPSSAPAAAPAFADAPNRPQPIPAAAVQPSSNSSSVLPLPVASVPSDSVPPTLGGYQRGAAPVVDFQQEAARRSLAARVLPWTGWAIAAGLALTTGNLYQKSEGLKRSYASEQAQLSRTAADAATARDVVNAMTDEAAMRVTLTRRGALLTPTGRTVYSAEKGILIFSATNLEPVQSFKVYELWLIPANGGNPIPAGTFRPDAKGTASMVLTTLPKGVDAKAFGITIEDDGGSKVPTPPILMTGA